MFKHIYGFLKMKYEMWLMRQLDKHPVCYWGSIEERYLLDEIDRLEKQVEDLEFQVEHKERKDMEYENELQSKILWLIDRNDELEKENEWYEQHSNVKYYER